MRSPEPTFDLQAALTEEVRAAIDALGDEAPARPKAVHRCRVRLKRARALARIGRAGAPGLSKVFRDSARTVMHTLEQARDLAALAEAARKIAQSADKKSAAVLEATARQLDEERDAITPIDVPAVQSSLRDLLAIAQVWPQLSPRQLRAGAKRIRRRARRARTAGKASRQPERRHAWRRREKDRLYAVTVLGRSWPGKRRIGLSGRLSDTLGHERDALLLTSRLESKPDAAGDAKAAKRARRLVKRASRKLAKRADRLGAKIHAGGA